MVEILDCSVLVPTCNRPKMVEACLESLRNQTCHPQEVIVLDQSDGCRTQAVSALFDVRHVSMTQKNKSAALNLGIQESSGRYVCVIDDDCVADQEWLEALAKAFSTGQKRIVTGRVVAGAVEPGAVRSRLHDDCERPVVFQVNLFTPIFILSGCNFGFHRALVEKVGGFNVDFGPGSTYRSSEDNEWAYRALRKGYKIHYEPNAVVVHRSWRSLDEDREHMRTYGLAAGAFITEVLSASKLDGAFHLLRISKWLLCELMRNRNEPELRRPFALYARGFLTGMRAYRRSEGVQ